jgi:transposase InsO family protein
MKINFSRIGLVKLCGWFGITRQAYYQNNQHQAVSAMQEDLILREVKEIRSKHPRMGARKLLTILQPLLSEHHIKMGRDALFTTLSSNHLLVRKRKRRIQTTQSFHWLRKYPNLIKDFVPSGINQLWVSDITYWKVNVTHLYLNFITDAFSHKIVGYNLGETLESVESLQALRMALSALGAESHTQLIHHSDRGLQYCSHSYVDLLNKHGIQISMTEDGNPRENAIAERLNGIMKGEYLENYKFTSMIQAKQLIQSKVDLYNHERPHMSISNLTPSQIHKPGQTVQTKRLWKNYYPKPPIVNL